MTKPRAPVGSAHGALEISEQDWLTLEDRYGRSLSKKVREGLSRIAERYAERRQFETGAPSYKDVARQLADIEGAADGLAAALSTDVTTTLLQQLLSPTFDASPLDEHAKFSGLDRMLRSLSLACADAERQLTQMERDGTGFLPNDSWEDFVGSSLNILKANNLPSGVSYQEDKDKLSPAAQLLDGIDSLLPERLRQRPALKPTLCQRIKVAAGKWKESRVTP